MSNVSSCPESAQLQQLLQGHFREAEASALEEHLSACDHCGKVADGLKIEDTLADAIRVGTATLSDYETPKVHEIIGRLRQVRPVATPAALDVTAAERRTDTPSEAEMEPASIPETTEEGYAFLSSPQGPGELGRLGSYRVLKVLGTGGMGVVFQAEDVHLERLVALKAMKPSVAANKAAKQRFLREAKACAALKHDHVVTIHQVGEERGIPFIAMEFLQGLPLDEWLAKGRKATVPQILRIGREVAKGLAAAHDKGLIHRDIKPGNIWLDKESGRVKILDFGLARTQTENVNITQSGAVVGTPAYMAPEQARGEAVDGRCDLFSLGCVLYKLCTGHVPFTGDTTMAVLMSLALETPKPVHELNSAIPLSLSDLIVKLLAKDVKDRPASAKEVIKAIQAIEGTVSGSHTVATAPVAVPALPAANPFGDLTEAGSKLVVPPKSAPVKAKKAPANAGRHAPEKASPVSPRADASRSPNRRRPLVAAALALVLGGAVLAGIIIIIRNKDGSQTTITPATDAEVRVKQGDKEVYKFPPEKLTDKDRLQGRWTPVSAEFDGKPMPAEMLKMISTVLFNGDQMSFTQSDQKREGTFKLDPDKNPKEIDVIRAGDEKGMRGIYKLDSDTLQLCMGEPGTPRPPGFVTKAGTTVLSIILRQASPHDLAFFNGKDLSGFRESSRGSWKVVNGGLVGKAGNGVSALTTVNAYADFEVSFRCRYPSVEKSLDGPAFSFRQGVKPASLKFGKNIGLNANFKAQPVAVRDNEFNDVSVRCVGPRVKVVVNGNVMVDGEFDVDPSGKMGWTPAQMGEVEIQDIRFTNLSKPAAATDPDRAVAAWALEAGGRVTLQVGGTTTTLLGKKGETDLPAEPFRVLKLYFQYIGPISAEKLAQLQNLPRLESLGFYLNNQWSGDFTPHLAALTNLKFLQVSNTKPQHLATLEFLRNFANLEELIVGSRNNFGDEALAPIADLKKLRILDLKFSPISDADLVHFRDLPLLKELDLSSTKISDAGLRQLSSRLTRLSLAATSITDAGLRQLPQQLPNLTSLNLSRNKTITAEGVKKLQAALPRCKITMTEPESDPDRAVAAWALEAGGRVTLQVDGKKANLYGKKDAAVPDQPFQVVGLSFTYPQPIPADKLAQLQMLPQLESLTFQLTDRWSGDLGNHLAGLTNLKELRVGGARNHLADLAFLRGLSQLEKLDIGTWTNYSDEALAPIAELKKLRTLSLAGSPISDTGLSRLQDLPELADLNLSGTKIGDEGLRQLNPKVTRLKLSNTGITDVGLSQLPAQVPNLSQLILTSTPITDAGVEHLSKLSSLTQVFLAETKLTPAGVKKLQAALPKCKISMEPEPDSQADSPPEGP